VNSPVLIVKPKKYVLLVIMKIDNYQTVIVFKVYIMTQMMYVKFVQFNVNYVKIKILV